ncbi:hypothetical protein [Candidatus Avelusimicrobium fimicolum]|jgi:hypothetical protein|uniref:hypothetical protein n=1 Tax=Candidatus Avelusimicrobium fimicolum TaxID=3416216 RepID=UPI002068810B|nr:MAG TPA: hypothetical protein [Caudoviricetes sp.]
MNIAKVEVNGEWKKLKTLVQEQTGQSDFSFNSDTTYQLQAEGNFGVRLCVADSVPADKAGVRIVGTQTAHYKAEDGKEVWVKAVEGAFKATPLLDISTIGA